MHHLIIGGSDAGISAALRLKELVPTDQVTLLVADDYPNYSICGIPFYLSREVSLVTQLAHRTRQELEATGIRLLTKHRAVAIHPEEKHVLVTHQDNTFFLSYDRLLVATGGRSTRPDLPGIDLPGVFTLRWIDDMLAIEQYITEQSVQQVIIVGGGYIGLEMADALTRRGVTVTLLEKNPQVLMTLDQPLGALVRQELERHQVQIHTGKVVKSIGSAQQTLQVLTTDEHRFVADMVLVAVGAQPESSLATKAGIRVDQRGGIYVDQFMQTNISDIWAAGDCSQTWHALLQKFVYLPLGTTAHKQGRIAGENMAVSATGGQRPFKGTLGTQSVKLFELVAARTGLSDRDCSRVNRRSFTHQTQVWDHKAYYPQASPLTIRLTGDPDTGQLLGMQLVGRYGAEVAKRVDTVATALHAGLRVRDLLDLDLSYTPPLSSPWDPVQMAAMAWQQALRTNR